MFRTAILRSFSRAAAAPRTLVVAAPRFTVAVPAWSNASVRSYAAAAGLSKKEVEDRIKALLQGFDKVSLFCCTMTVTVGCGMDGSSEMLGIAKEPDDTMEPLALGVYARRWRQ